MMTDGTMIHSRNVNSYSIVDLLPIKNLIAEMKSVTIIWTYRTNPFYRGS